MAKPHPKQLITTDLIIIDTEGASEGLDLSEMKLNLNATNANQLLYPQSRRNLLKLKKKDRRYYK